MPIHLHNPLLPHEIHKEEKSSAISRTLLAAGISTILTAGFAFILLFYNISINVVLPSSAPIWVGTSSIIQNILIRR